MKLYVKNYPSFIRWSNGKRKCTDGSIEVPDHEVNDVLEQNTQLVSKKPFPVKFEKVIESNEE